MKGTVGDWEHVCKRKLYTFSSYHYFKPFWRVTYSTNNLEPDLYLVYGSQIKKVALCRVLILYVSKQYWL